MTDDEQISFVAKMGANRISTTRRLKDGSAFMDDPNRVRQWTSDSGKELRKWLTPAVMDRYNRLYEKDAKAAEKEFDSEVSRIRVQVLERYPEVR